MNNNNLIGTINVPAWLQGPAGPKGDKGDPGEPGKQGIDGKQGERGPAGPIGPIGPEGPKGADGTVEFGKLTPEQQASLKGPQGEKGEPGAVGPKGETGAMGPQGPAGASGKEGPQGIPGEKGADGQPGKDGDPGVYVGTVPPIKDDVFVWINPDGQPQEEIATKQYVDDEIAKIEQGGSGEPGFSPIAKVEANENGAVITITDKVGTTTATVTNGKDGAVGPQGEPGKDGQPGANGKDATINGVNALNIVEGDNITLSQSGETLTISATGGGSETPIATTAIAGKVKPDGTSITVDADGTIHGASGGGGGFPLEDRMFKCDGIGTVKVGTNDITGTTLKNSLVVGDYMQNGGSAKGKNSIVIGEGNKTPFSLIDSILVGYGNGTWNTSNYNCGAIGKNIILRGIEDSFGIGEYLEIESNAQFVSGKNNIADTANTYAHIVGNGSSSARDNAYTLDWKGNASFKGKVSSQGADYAEYFEWLDKNPAAEDRVGYIVTLEGNKIKLADAADDVLGIISGTVGVLGDNYEWNWQGKYLTDDFGRIQIDMVEEFTEHENEKGEIEKISLGKFPHPRLNPAYNPDEEYVNRANRKEWDAVGMMGKLYVRDDGTATVGGYVKPAHGIATASTEKTNMKVMERVKDNIIRVVLK